MFRECNSTLDILSFERKSSKSLLLYNNPIIDSSLVSRKSFLEVLLNQIKSSQNNLLSKKNNSKKYLKGCIIKLKKNLQKLQDNKKKAIKYLEKENKIIKEEAQDKLFAQNEDSNKTINKTNLYSSVDSINYFKEGKECAQIDYLKEIESLKLLSFKVENQINEIEYEVKKKINTILGLKIARLYQEEDLEVKVQNKKLRSTAYRIMKANLKKYKDYLIMMLDKNIETNKEEKIIYEQIKHLKQEKQKRFKKIFYPSNDTIIEEQNNTTKEKIDYDSDYKNKNKNIVNNCKIDNKYKHTSENTKKDTYNIDFEEINNMITNRVLRSFSNKNKRKNILFNKDNCNLKIQLNFNFNNINIINSKNSDDKITDINNVKQSCSCD